LLSFLDSSLLASIRPSLEDDKPAVHAQPVQDGRGRHGIEDLAPLGGDKIGGDDGRPDLRAFGDDLENAIGLVLGRKDIAQLS